MNSHNQVALLPSVESFTESFREGIQEWFRP